MANAITIRFLADVKKLNLRFPIAMISKRTGFSKSNVSEYLNGKKEPSDNFIKKFYSLYYPASGITEELVMYEPEAEYMKKDDQIKNLERIIQAKDETIAELRRTIEILQTNPVLKSKKTRFA